MYEQDRKENGTMHARSCVCLIQELTCNVESQVSGWLAFVPRILPTRHHQEMNVPPSHTRLHRLSIVRFTPPRFPHFCTECQFYAFGRTKMRFNTYAGAAS